MYAYPPRVPGRRQVLGLGAAALGGLLLPGCTTSGGYGSRRSSCLAAVRVSPSRVIRTSVGLRPWRASGYVVREERVGGTRVIHNYGHGGGGITLSWGSSAQAVELGLRGHSRKDVGRAVAVIGAGVMGLTTARLLQEEGFAVTLYTGAMPEGTTSAVSGGQFYPSLLDDGESMPAGYDRQLYEALRYSHRRFMGMRGARYGVRVLPNYEVSDRPLGHGRYAGMMDAILGRADELSPREHPFPRHYVRVFETPMIEPRRLLGALLEDVRRDGGRVAVRSFSHPRQINALPERLVFNCTGLGSRALFGDAALRPRRGQLVWLQPQPEVAYAVIGTDGLYMFPRSDGVLLGGTWDLDDWNMRADPATTRRLLAGHGTFFSGLHCA